MNPLTRLRLIDSLHCCYQGIGPDVWGEKTPKEKELLDVLRAQIETHIWTCNRCLASKEDVLEFHLLSETEQMNFI